VANNVIRSVNRDRHPPVDDGRLPWPDEALIDTRLMRRRPTRDTGTAQEQQPTWQRPGPMDCRTALGAEQQAAPGGHHHGPRQRESAGATPKRLWAGSNPAGPRPPIEAAEWEETHMDTTTCEICKRPPAEGNPVAPIDLGATEPAAVCDLCCELLAAELAVLSVLK